jgi:hypothetical protein
MKSVQETFILYICLKELGGALLPKSEMSLLLFLAICQYAVYIMKNDRFIIFFLK